MSSLLEQAIVDATALKEAALKNAEAAVLEKYAPEIKKAVESLLEQEEDPFAMAGGAPEGPVDADVDAPLAATEGENMCGCPDEEESTVVTVNFDKLLNAMEDDPNAEPEEDQDDLAMAALEEDSEVELSDDLLEAILSELSSHDDEDESAQVMKEEDDEKAEEDDEKAEEGDDDNVAARTPPRDKKNKTDFLPKDVRDKINADAKNEELDLDEDALTAMVEKLVVDMAQRKTGHLGVSEDTAKYELELELARQQSTDFKEENEALKKAVEELQEKLSKYDFTINEMKQKLHETNLTNARLLYANRILNSTSLNERQKNKLVEAISNAGSVKEAKVIYETLRNTVGSAPDRRGPQSLREAVTRSSSIMSVRENRTKTADPAAERMQILAGIKK
jgi:hypothetical protein